MSESKATLTARANKLRRQIAETEATLDNLRAKLAAAEVKLGAAKEGNPPVSGLEMLWQIALPMARTRSSKQQCRVEFNRIPKADRPTIQTMLEALAKWNRCPEWKLEGNRYVPGLHKWIKNRQWDNPPDLPTEAPSRYRSAPKAIPKTAPEEAASPEDIAAAFAAIAPRRMHS